MRGLDEVLKAEGLGDPESDPKRVVIRACQFLEAGIQMPLVAAMAELGLRLRKEAEVALVVILPGGVQVRLGDVKLPAERSFEEAQARLDQYDRERKALSPLEKLKRMGLM